MNCGIFFRRSGFAIGRTFGAGTGKIWLDGVSCDGTENSLAECERRPWGAESCDHNNDISITCKTDLSYAIGKLSWSDSKLPIIFIVVVVFVSKYTWKVRTLAYGNCDTLFRVWYSSLYVISTTVWYFNRHCLMYHFWWCVLSTGSLW